MTDIYISARRGAGAPAEILYGTVTFKPTLAHSRSTSIVLPAPTTFDLVDGEVVATNVQPTPEPVEGKIEWAYEVTFKDRHSKTYSFLVGVPDSTTQVNFTSLPRYFETAPPLFGQGPQGVPGESATLAVGTVTSGATPNVTNSGTNTDAVLNFTLPKGDKGDTGDGVPEGGSALQIIRKDPTGATTEWTDLTKALVGLSNVDNTSDTSKPVSTPQKTYIDQSNTLPYMAKIASDAPNTYPEGVTVGLFRVGDGWPATVAGASFTVIKTDVPRQYAMATQWAYAYKPTEALVATDSPILYRQGYGALGWGEWQEVATKGWATGQLDEVNADIKKVKTSLLTPGYGTPQNFNSHEQTVSGIYLYEDQTIVHDVGGNRIIDGAQLFSMIRVGDRPGSWRDEYYGYVSGHGGYIDPLEKGYTWLLSAPSPYGPWTFHEPVIGSDSISIMESHLVGPRCSGPNAMWVGDEIWLNFHGGGLNSPWYPGYDYRDRWGSPSVLAKSTDGINFVEHGIVLSIDKDVTDMSPYAASTAYRRTIKENGLWHSVWQANTTNVNDQTGIQTYTVGHAISADGVNWIKQPPLLGNEPGDQGPFSPSLVKAGNGWLLVCTYRRNVAGTQVGLPRAYYAKELKPGAFRSLGDIYLPDREGRTQRAIQSPFFFVHEGDLHMAYGGTVDSSNKSVISCAKVGWK